MANQMAKIGEGFDQGTNTGQRPRGRPTYSPGGVSVTATGDNIWSRDEIDRRYPGGSGIPPGMEFAPVSGQPGNYYYQAHDYMADMMEQQAASAEMMAQQMEMQADYNAQMAALQEQSLQQQQEAARAGNVEASKTASDFTVANADDNARKQMLRRGMMSTYTRYGGNQSGGGTAKATKLGG